MPLSGHAKSALQVALGYEAGTEVATMLDDHCSQHQVARKGHKDFESALTGHVGESGPILPISATPPADSALDPAKPKKERKKRGPADNHPDEPKHTDEPKPSPPPPRKDEPVVAGVSNGPGPDGDHGGTHGPDPAPPAGPQPEVIMPTLPPAGGPGVVDQAPVVPSPEAPGDKAVAPEDDPFHDPEDHSHANPA